MKKTIVIEALQELVELGYVEKLPPRPGETEPRWRCTEFGKSQPTLIKGKTMGETAPAYSGRHQPPSRG